ncbi:MAG: conjugal transfer protein TraL [Deltaproteobacteria bacterium RIFOXYD12_FULL_50_9]|nr:MAG: conjugal transfer protein TraL [Deltaproteobacteria bacterium RIFOXYD12_FULL_50_9]
MADDFQKPFSQYLASPFQVLWYETDELGVLMFSLSLAFMYGNFFWLLVVVAPYFYSKVKKSRPRGFLRHLLYFGGFIKFKGYPLYLDKEFRE